MKPTIQKISPFDVTCGCTVNIIWAGGIPKSSKIIICDADSLEVIYEQEIANKLEHEIPANIEGMKNGKQYTIQCYVTDTSNISEISDKVQFRTFTTPSFIGEIQDINDSGEIGTASVTMNVTYSQEEGESLGLYKFYLYYKSDKYETPIFYNTEKISHTFNGLDNGAKYKLQCIGSTVSGMEVKTELFEIIVNYKSPDDYARFMVENEPDKGCNNWYTNIVIVSYRGEEKFTYTMDEEGNPEYIDLTDKSLYYGNDGSISIPNDCSIIISGKGFKSGTIFDCMDSQTFEHLTISAYIYDDNQIRFKLMANNGLNDYIIYSKPLLFHVERNFVIEIKKKGILYSINSY